MAHSTGRLKKGNGARGETLVETIVAFAVLMILLALVTTAVRAGIALNNRAIQNIVLLNNDCTELEMGAGLTGVGSDTLKLTFMKGGTGTLRILLDVQAASGGKLRSFKTNAPQGGGG